MQSSLTSVSTLQAQQIDVLVNQLRQPADIFRLYGKSLGSELL